MRAAMLVLVAAAMEGMVGALPAKLGKVDEVEEGPHHARDALVVKMVDKINLELFDQQEGVSGGADQVGVKISPMPGRLPAGWRPRGSADGSSAVHAQVLDNGDVAIVLYDLQDGFEVVLLPAQLFRGVQQEFHAIVFPEDPKGPWHPQPPPTTSVHWEWAGEDVTPGVLRPEHFPKPIKVVNTGGY